MLLTPPTTEYGDAIKESSVSIPEQLLKEFTYINIGKEIVEKLGKELLDDFESWKTENSITYTTTPSKLGVSISYLNLNGVTKGRHTRDGDSKYYNKPLLKEHFKIGNCELSINDSKTEEEIVEYELIET